MRPLLSCIANTNAKRGIQPGSAQRESKCSGLVLTKRPGRCAFSRSVGKDTTTAATLLVVCADSSPVVLHRLYDSEQKLCDFLRKNNGLGGKVGPRFYLRCDAQMGVRQLIE